MAEASKFKLYNVIVRLGGSRYNEVRKSNVTAPEVMLFGSIHGSDSIVDPTPTGKFAKTKNDPGDSECKKYHSRTQKEERGRLMHIFEGNDATKRGFVQRVFGPATVPLPYELDGDYEPAEQVPVQIIPPGVDVEPGAALVA